MKRIAKDSADLIMKMHLVIPSKCNVSVDFNFTISDGKSDST